MCLLVVDEPVSSTLRAAHPLLQPCPGDRQHHRVTVDNVVKIMFHQLGTTVTESIHATPPLYLVQIQGESTTDRPGRVRRALPALLDLA